MRAPQLASYRQQGRCQTLTLTEDCSDVERFRDRLKERRDLMDPSQLRELERRETQERRTQLELRTDLSPTVIAARRLSDDNE